MAQTKGSLNQVQLFATLSREVLRKIRTALSSEIFLPGDVIVRAGSPGKVTHTQTGHLVLIYSRRALHVCASSRNSGSNLNGQHRDVLFKRRRSFRGSCSSSGSKQGKTTTSCLNM